MPHQLDEAGVSENGDRDSLDCWLRSVEEAKRSQVAFQQSLAKITKIFKPRPKTTTQIPVTVWSTDTVHSLESDPTADDSCSEISLADFNDVSTVLSRDLDPGWLLIDI
jgi:hypothetical protein